VLNFKPANVLGLTVAPYLLACANEVIEWRFLAALHESESGTQLTTTQARE